ncbi:Flavin_Reduct domain-containing protein [Hyphomicrobiales bacterium]|nr:Flavin_Reduct domain-containing protein [Hyphomicrobiales bacterium]CAH1697361.1 Flavin reductase [Hyphomicrobiales bacterium]CAI0345550.1 Flavin_Reduct domain-containing protein [Hyphomicrobiales bacterium]
MTHVALADLGNRERYWLITGSVGPRPIGLVTSLDSAGACNAAPFSAFSYLSETPALMIIGVDLYGDESHRPGQRKDTLNNIVANGEFVVNMVDEPILQQAVHCGSDFPQHLSEPDAVGFATAPSTLVKVPRIAEAPIAWECRVFKLLEYAAQRTFVIGEIVAMYFRDDLIDLDRMRVRVERFSPVGRLGGPNYCRTSDRLTIPVPTFGNGGTPRI